MATIGNLSTVTKNLMLNAWRNTTSYAVVATNDAGSLRSNKVQVSFNAASNGKLTISSPVTLTITSGSDGTNAIKKLFVEPTANETEQIGFVIATAIDFPAGGNLVVTQLDVELEDPA